MILLLVYMTNINIRKYLKYADSLALEKIGSDVEVVVPLGVESSKLFPEYKRLEFKIFLKNREEMFMNLFLKNNKIIGYDFVTKD